MNRKKILIVDDNVDAAEMLQLFLESEGYETRTVFDSRVVTSLLNYFYPDLILMDIGMPVLNGYDLNRVLKQDEEWKHLPVFALTGFSSPETRVKIATEGFLKHFIKPVDVEEFTEYLKEFFNENK